MIHVSMKLMDLAFVATTLRKHNLQGRPVDNFHMDEGYWLENPRWKRVMERYTWGVIMYASDRKNGDHFTAVIEGDFDPATGMAGADKLDVSWYEELVNSFEATVADKIEVPNCIGWHEADPTCDGGLNTAGEIEQACGWRGRCIPFQAHCAKLGKEPNELLNGKTPEEILALTGRLRGNAPAAPPPAATPEASAKVEAKNAAEHADVAPVPIQAPTVSSPKAASKKAAPAKPAQPAAKSAPKLSAKPAEPYKSPWASERYAEALPLVTALWTAILTAWGKSSFVDISAAKAGDLFVKDRTQKSDYISVYMKREKGVALALCSVRLRKGGRISIQLPIALNAARHAYKEVGASVEGWADGQFKSVVRDLEAAESMPFIVAPLFGWMAAHKEEK